jgi:RecG-like helicase
MARRTLRQRLGSSVAELERTRLQKRFLGLDLTPLEDLALRRPIRVGGEISRVVIAPRSGVPTLEVMVSDGTGNITAVFTGRRTIAGLEHGRAVILEGVATREADRNVIFNPAYTLVS